MPFEVFPVQGMVNRFTDSRGPQEVARDIATVYEKAAEQSGRILTQHEVESSGFGQGKANFTYLVAELPELPAEPS